MTMRLTAALILVLMTFSSLAADEPPPGALSCSGCHAAGTSLPLDRFSATEIAEAMAAFKSGEREATLMKRIAAGFDETEITAIAEWIAGRSGY